MEKFVAVVILFASSSWASGTFSYSHDPNNSGGMSHSNLNELFSATFDDSTARTSETAYNNAVSSIETTRAQGQVNAAREQNIRDQASRPQAFATSNGSDIFSRALAQQIAEQDRQRVPFRLESPAGAFRDRLATLGGQLNQVSPNTQQQRDSRELGLLSVQESDSAYSQGDTSEANWWYERGKEFLDIALGLHPTTGFAQSVYEFTLGKSLTTGADLETWDRTMAFLGIVTGGGSKSLASLGKAQKFVSRVFNRFSHLIKRPDRARVAAQEGTRIADSARRNSTKWGHWVDLEKVTVNGREYAPINNRLFTRHAVEHMAPKGLGGAAGPNPVLGRGVPPNVVEDVLTNGRLVNESVANSGAARQTWLSDGVQVITEQGKRIIVTIMRVGGQ